MNPVDLRLKCVALAIEICDKSWSVTPPTGGSTLGTTMAQCWTNPSMNALNIITMAEMLEKYMLSAEQDAFTQLGSTK